MPDNIDRLFRSNHRIRGLGAERLTPEEVERLRAIVTRREPDARRVRALGLFAATRARDVGEVLYGVLGSPDERPAVRAVAAMEVARSGAPDAEGLLVRGLEADAPPLVRARVADALGRVGGRAALDALGRLVEGDPEPFVRRQAGFARTLVAHRARLPGYEIRPPDDSEILRPQPRAGRRASRLSFAAAPAREAEAALADLARDGYGVRLSGEQARRFRCGRAQNILLFNDEVARGGLDVGELGRPVVLGVVAERAPADGSHSVSRVLLAGPEGRGAAYVAAFRTDGVLTHYGVARGERGEGEFMLISVRGAGEVPSEVGGRVVEGRLLVSHGLAELRVDGVGRPSPLTPGLLRR